MKFIFAGGAREVGGSCIYIRCNNRGILLDAGIRQSAKKDPIPDFQSIQEAGGVDVILISHAHMDHIGTLPVISKAYPDARIHMTPMSMELTRILLKDSLKIMDRKETEIPHYSETDVSAMMERIVPVPYLTPYEVFDGFSFTFYPAGHIAGAACINLRTPEGDVFYSGDFSTFRQRTIEGMRIPKLRPDIAIFESTYGNRLHSNRETEENRLIETVREFAEKGGKVLIPAFALGRAQEVLLILQSAIKSKKLPDIPVYVDGMVRDINMAYMNHPNDLRLPLTKAILKGNQPFYSEHVTAVTTKPTRSELLSQSGCAVFVSSSGMLTGGPSVEYAKTLVQDENACIIITGYQDEEAPGRLLQNMMTSTDENRTVTLDGSVLPLRCRIVQVGLSAHSDSSEITSVIERLSCRRIILVHGDEDAMTSLGASLSADFRNHVYQPGCGTILNMDIHNRRKQISTSLTETLHLSAIQDEADLKMIYTFWKEHYNLRSFTVQEIWMLSTGHTLHAERLRQEEKDALAQLEALLENNIYISRDPRRMFLFRLNSEEDIQLAEKPKETTMQDVQALINTLLKGVSIRKTGFHQAEKKVSLMVDYPDAFDTKLLNDIQNAVMEETGWTVVLSPAINHQAASLLLSKLFGSSLGKVSHYDDRHTYSIIVTLSADAIQEQIASFESTTGWKLTVNGVSTSAQNPVIQHNQKTDDFFYPSSDNSPMEINRALALIDSIFNGSRIKPYKKGRMTDMYGPYISLSFLSPELALRIPDVLQECADQTGYRISIRKSVNQNMIQISLMTLCARYGIDLQRTPAFIVNDNCFEIRTSTTDIPSSFFEEFEEETGLTVRIH